MAQPIVRPLLLPAVANLLAEDAVLVAQPVAHRRQLQRRHRIEIAGGEPAQAAVAQACIRLLVEDLHPAPAVLVEGALDYRIEHEIEDVVGERAADEELDRQIVDALRVLARVGLVGAQPTVGENVSHGACGRLVAFA